MRKLVTLVRTLLRFPEPTLTPDKVKREVSTRLRMQGRTVERVTSPMRADYQRQDDRMAGRQ